MEHEDLRITRTKQLIKNAFLDLIDEHGFEAVTVKAITERAGRLSRVLYVRGPYGGHLRMAV